MKPKHTVLLDTNIILRFFREDHPEHFKRATRLFQQGEKGKISYYIDSVVLAEVIWTLASFYKVNRVEITTKLEALLAQKWMVNEHKQTLLSALRQFQESNLDYIDCWLLSVSEEKHIPLETFDAKLKKRQKTSSAI